MRSFRSQLECADNFIKFSLQVLSILFAVTWTVLVTLGSHSMVKVASSQIRRWIIEFWIITHQGGFQFLLLHYACINEYYLQELNYYTDMYDYFNTLILLDIGIAIKSK